jgi:hypothetical protein
VCNIYSDMCCLCCSIFENAELRFSSTQNEINSFPYYVDILLASRVSAYKKVVSIVKHMFVVTDVILAIIFYDNVFKIHLFLILPATMTSPKKTPPLSFPY